MKYFRITPVELLEKVKYLKHPFQITVDHNPMDEGGRQTLWAHYNDRTGKIATDLLNQEYLGLDYDWDVSWTDGRYRGLFDLNTNPFENIRPTPYAVGDKVKVLENIKECKDFFNNNIPAIEAVIGGIYEISHVADNGDGLSYLVSISSNPTKRSWFPHYCLELQPPEPKEKTININGKDYTMARIVELFKNNPNV